MDTISTSTNNIVSNKTTGFTIASMWDDTIHIKYTKIRTDAVEPSRGSSDAAGYDLYIPLKENEIIIPPHQTVKIDIGISVALPDRTFGGIFARSGLATKQGLRPANCVGVVDSDYRGSIVVALYNDTDKEQVLKGGDRIAQLIAIPYIPLTFELTDSLDDTQRGSNAFGSTGV